jgi:hypothetical protein
MPISEKDRRDYERGIRDRNRPVVEQVAHDIVINHPDTRTYHMGRRGEELDLGGHLKTGQ